MQIDQYHPYFNRQELARKLSEFILGDTFLTEFKKTEELEKALCDYLKVKYCSMVPSGTLALVCALIAHGVKPGDSVLIPNITMMSTQSAVDLIGAKPIFIDISPNNLCMDIKSAREYIENNPVKAIIYVTLNGRSHGMGELQEFYDLCTAYKVGLIEDNAQSFGSMHNDNTLISCPKDGIGCFSLSFHKLLQTGQGGFLVTNNDYFGNQIKKLKNVGRLEGGADVHEEFGINAKFTDVQAVIGLHNLNYINDQVKIKRALYKLYYDLLKYHHQIRFINTDLKQTTPWFIDIFVEKRDELIQFLKNNGIGTRAIYPPLTNQKLNNPFKMAHNLPNSYNYSYSGLWLPTSIDLSISDIYYICDKIKEFYNV